MEIESQNQDLIGKSQLTRYFEQLDDLWAERFRRAANRHLTLANNGGLAALEFQKRCQDRKVPLQALEKIKSVRAQRTVGYGSTNAKRQALNRMFARLGLYDESGRRKVLEDLTSADVGYTNMRRYIAKDRVSADELDQTAEATDKVAGMKTGVKPIITPSQNPVIYAQTWLKAADEAAGTLANTNGQTIHEVFSFLEVAGPAIAAQLERFKDDGSRKGLHDKMTKHWQQLAALHDKLGKQLKQQAQEQMKKQQQMQQRAQEMNFEQQLKAREVAGKLDISRTKQRETSALRAKGQETTLALKVREHQVKTAIADATAAAEIRRGNLKSLSE